MINYPVRCCCFLVVGLSFFFPMLLMYYGYNVKITDEHVLFTKTNCLLVEHADLDCFGTRLNEGEKCVLFSLNYTESGCPEFTCNASGPLDPLKRNIDIHANDSVTCFYETDKFESTNTSCTLSRTQEMDPECGSLSEDFDNIPLADDDDTYEGGRPRQGTEGQLVIPPPGCFFVMGNVSAPFTYINDDTDVIVRCITSNEALVERLFYGGLAILLEGFFMTFFIISMGAVALSVFIDKSPGNDAYCFNVRL